MADADRTTAVEGLALTLKDQASGPADKVSSAFERVHHATERASQQVAAFGRSAALGALGAVGLGLGFREIWEKAKDANLELEDSAKKIAGVHFAFGGWRSDISAADKWKYSLAEGTEVVKRLEGAESKLKMTRSDLAGVYKSAYAVGTKHNLNQEQMLDLTEKLAASQKVLGVDAQFAATSISRAAMSGNIRGFDDFNKQLKWAVGNMKEFHKMSESARFAKMQKALSDLMPAAEGMGKGIAGAMFDIRKSVTEMTRDLSGPVFQEITHSLQTWAKEISHVRQDGSTIVQEYGQDLVSAFHTMQDVTGFLLDNWKEIAAIWASFKLTSWMGAGSMGGKGGLARALGAMAPTVATTTEKLTSFAGKLGMAAGLLGIFYEGLQGLASWLAKKHDESIEAKGISARTQSAVSAYVSGRREISAGGKRGETAAIAALGHMDTAMEAYGMKAGQHFSAKMVAADLAAMGPDLASRVLEKAGAGSYGKIRTQIDSSGVTLEMGRRLADDMTAFIGALEGAYPHLKDKADPHVTKAEHITNIGHVTITQEFKESDPDRVFHKAVNEIDHMVNAPRGATTNALGA